MYHLLPAKEVKVNHKKYIRNIGLKIGKTDEDQWLMMSNVQTFTKYSGLHLKCKIYTGNIRKY